MERAISECVVVCVGNIIAGYNKKLPPGKNAITYVAPAIAGRDINAIVSIFRAEIYVLDVMYNLWPVGEIRLMQTLYVRAIKDINRCMRSIVTTDNIEPDEINALNALNALNAIKIKYALLYAKVETTKRALDCAAKK